MPHGTDAISAALAGALDLDGIGEGGEVIIPNYTFIATASAPISVRCSLALVDIDPDSFTILPRSHRGGHHEQDPRDHSRPSGWSSSRHGSDQRDC